MFHNVRIAGNENIQDLHATHIGSSARNVIENSNTIDI